MGASDIACRYTRIARPGEFAAFTASSWIWRKLGVAERRCESWRCGIVDPLIEVAHDLPPGSRVHVNSLAMHEGDYELDGLCFVRSDANLTELMSAQLEFPLEGCYRVPQGFSSSASLRQVTALRPTSMVSDRFDLTEPFYYSSPCACA